VVTAQIKVSYSYYLVTEAHVNKLSIVSGWF